MTKPIFYLLFLLSLDLSAQLTDAFTDGDYIASPAWTGDLSGFIVNSSGQLQLNSSGTDTSYLSTTNSEIDSAEWNFWIKLSFAPSDNNYAKIYIVSDQANLKSALNGYFVRLGENGSFDSVDLWEQSGKTETKIIDGINGHCAKSTNVLRIKIIRDNSGNWKLFSDTLSGTNYALEGSANDLKHTNTAYFGISCKYTSSNSNKFYFDDFYVGPINVDKTPPAVLNIYSVAQNAIDIYFSERVDTSFAQNVLNYSVSDGIGFPVNAKIDAANKALIHLKFSTLYNYSKTYSIKISGIKDLQGNSMDTLSNDFVLPEKAVPNDLIINEILSDPNTGGADFVEVYNRSVKVIDFSRVLLCSFDTITNQLSSIHSVSTDRKLIFPQQYIVLTSNAAAVKNQYYTPNPSGFIEMSSIPAMNIASGIVILADSSENIIDRFDYNQNMHFALLNDTKGISLERISPDRPTEEKSNWHSAASGVGFATPAYKNSESIDTRSAKEITLSPEIFSPDNDGHNDVLTINYTFDKPGNTGSIFIYNSTGNIVRNLVSNELLGNAGSYNWDGINDQKELCPIGPYIVYFQSFNEDGTVKNYKNVTVLAHKL